MIVSIAIMAHPNRARYVPGLQGGLPGAVVVWDEKNERWDTGRRSMLAFDPGADWHLVVQDDCILCQDFLMQAQHAISEVSSGPIAFYCGTTAKFGHLRSGEAMRQALRRNQRWLKAPGPYWGPAVAVRTSDIPAMIEWCDQRGDIPNYDRRMSRYFYSLDRLCWYSVPCLVNHRIGPENPSLIAGRGSSPGRTAALWTPNGRREWTRAVPLVAVVEEAPSPGQSGNRRTAYKPIGRDVRRKKR
jgi:hypothetical protein